MVDGFPRQSNRQFGCGSSLRPPSLLPPSLPPEASAPTKLNLHLQGSRECKTWHNVVWIPEANLSYPRIWTGASPPNLLLPSQGFHSTRGCHKCRDVAKCNKGPAGADLPQCGIAYLLSYLLDPAGSTKYDDRNLMLPSPPRMEPLLLLLLPPCLPNACGAPCLAGMKPRWWRNQRNLLNSASEVRIVGISWWAGDPSIRPIPSHPIPRGSEIHETCNVICVHAPIRRPSLRFHDTPPIPPAAAGASAADLP